MYDICRWNSVLVYFSFRWWQFRRRPSHHPFGKAWICIQLRASTDVSTPSQSSTQGPAAHPPDQNSCCGWRGNLFNGGRNCASTCCREHNLIKLKRLLLYLLYWYRHPFFFFFNFHKKGPHCCPVAHFVLTRSYWLTRYSSLFPLPKRREKNFNCHWSPAEWLRYFLTQPFTWSYADRQN